MPTPASIQACSENDLPGLMRFHMPHRRTTLSRLIDLPGSPPRMAVRCIPVIHRHRHTHTDTQTGTHTHTQTLLGICTRYVCVRARACACVCARM